MSEILDTLAYMQGAREERERTIKLLKQLRCDKTHDCGKWHDHYPYTPDELIELINGETP